MKRIQQSPLRTSAFLLLASGINIAITGCGSGFTSGAAAISASANTVRVNQTVQLAPALSIVASSMSYSVNGIAGGTDILGHIDSNGVYTAPAVVPSPSNMVTLSGTSSMFPSDSTSVMVGVLNPIPVVGTITPSSFSEGTATITVSGSQFVYGAQITWNGTPVATTFVSGTELAAVVAAPTPGTYNLIVTNPNPGSASSAQVSERVVPGQVALVDQPNNGTSVRVGNSITFGLTVTGTNNTGVTWSVNEIPGGNATFGTVVTNPDGSITYTAPLVVPTPNNVVTLTGVSVDNPAVSMNQNVAVLNPVPVLLSGTPLSFSPGAATVVLTGNSFINGAQVLVNGVAMPTTFNSGTQLTANLTLTTSGNIDLQVLNPAPGPATSADLIATVTGTPPTPLVPPTDAARFLTQATFGPTDSDIRTLGLIGYNAWFAQQFATAPTLHEPAVEQQVLLNNPPCAAGDLVCNTTLFMNNSAGQASVEQSFWQQAIAGNDQLRQRVVYALTQIEVVSGTDPNAGNMPRGLANYEDVLGADAFGNFRQIMQDVTLNPMMGLFLSTLGNDKGNANTDPDENYAREVMQLLTIGLYQLNPDGTQKLDATGAPIPTFNNNDVMGLAKVFTGFSWQIPGDSSDAGWNNSSAYVGTGFGEEILPMRAYQDHHSVAEKDFLGVTIAASSTPDANGDLKIALDTLFNHPNLPPFISHQLIQHLVTSDPSPAYVGRVAAVFQNDGTGTRGNMQAVIQAILMDDEARNTANATSNPQYGKVRESLLRYTEWARAFSAQSRGGVFNLGSTEDRIYALGEMTLRSPTVFNWFTPGYIPPNTSIQAAGMVAPEMQMTDVSTVVGYLNYLQSAIGSTAAGGPDVYSNYTTELTLASNPTQLVARLNLLLMANSMSANLQSQILAAVNAIAIPAGDQNAINAALANRVMTAIYLTMASPDFCAQV